MRSTTLKEGEAQELTGEKSHAGNLTMGKTTILGVSLGLT
jgi:hypothetical protein